MSPMTERCRSEEDMMTKECATKREEALLALAKEYYRRWKEVEVENQGLKRKLGETGK